jgi:hypothetical protein
MPFPYPTRTDGERKTPARSAVAAREGVLPSKLVQANKSSYHGGQETSTRGEYMLLELFFPLMVEEVCQ